MRPVALAACLALAGCATSAQVSEGQALADAWAGLNGAAIAADLAVKGGLHGPTAGKISADLKLASAALTDATNVYRAQPSSPTVASDIAAALTLTTEITALSTGGAK